jgi:hypothetical protein
LVNSVFYIKVHRQVSISSIHGCSYQLEFIPSIELRLMWSPTFQSIFSARVHPNSFHRLNLWIFISSNGFTFKIHMVGWVICTHKRSSLPFANVKLIKINWFNKVTIINQTLNPFHTWKFILWDHFIHCYSTHPSWKFIHDITFIHLNYL